MISLRSYRKQSFEEVVDYLDHPGVRGVAAFYEQQARKLLIGGDADFGDLGLGQGDRATGLERGVGFGVGAGDQRRRRELRREPRGVAFA